MSLNVGSAYGEVTIDTAGAYQGVLGLNGLLGNLGASMLNLNPITIGLGLAFAGIGVAVGGVTAAIFAGVDAASEFESVMARTGVLLGANETEMEQLAEQARQLGADTVWTAKQVGEAQQILAQAGFQADQILAATPGLLAMATAGQLDLAQASDIASATLRGFGLDASEAGRVADVLAEGANISNASVQSLGEALKYVAPVAAQAGLSMEETVAAIGALANAGIQGSMAGTSLRMGLLRLAAPTKKAQGWLDRLGVTVTDEFGNMRGFVDILGDLKQGMAGLGQAEQLEALKAIFGVESLTGMQVLINSLGDAQNGVVALATTLENSQGRAAEVASKQLDTLKGDYELLSGTIDSIKLAIGEEWLPIFRQVTQGINATLEGATPAIVGFFSNLAEVAQAAIPALLDFANRGIGSISQFFNDLYASFQQGGLSGLFDTLVAYLGQAGTAIWETVSQWGANFWAWVNGPEGVQTTAPQVLQGLLDSITTFLEENWPTIAKTLDRWGELFFQWVSTAITKVGEVMGPLLTALNTWATGDDAQAKMRQLGQILGDVVFDSMKLVLTNQERINGLVAQMVVGLGQAVIALLPTLFTIGQQMGAGVMEGMYSNLTGQEVGQGSITEGVIEGLAQGVLSAINPLAGAINAWNNMPSLPAGSGSASDEQTELLNQINNKLKPGTITVDPDALRQNGFLHTQDFEAVYL